VTQAPAETTWTGEQDGDFVPFSNCYGRSVIEGITPDPAGTGVFISPEQKLYLEKLRVAGGYTCKWPECPCAMSTVSGVFRRERIEWVIRRARQDPSFTLKDIPFTF
jgi:hypothetical protein